MLIWELHCAKPIELSSRFKLWCESLLTRLAHVLECCAAVGCHGVRATALSFWGVAAHLALAQMCQVWNSSVRCHAVICLPHAILW